ncbi:M1 family metallopeptidase [Nocardioides sp. YIM 152315]|uniref:M1 family metallopeptidase n=1 Tax=Nocardioides sp. YIM 152315 TaxID=3031760 RepID=UPI0023D9F6C2|nr:M1 family metallopeptidase [Nocardioides sp. YIM 152315]MDF1604267.1 M1 family metallopeptidase [Nocardioides sp. YIM 152315]
MKARLAAALAAALLLTGCTSGSDEPGDSPSPAPAASPTPERDLGVSTPVEDRVYPDVGDPGVDALSYDLDLTWDPATSTLEAQEEIRLRSTRAADHLQLDLDDDLHVARVTVDGRPAAFDHDGKDLVVAHRVRADDRYTLVVDYAGTPRPVPAPTKRQDFDTTGWTTTPDGEVWTMQEPYGAYSWYAVNDQPSDKALYSFRISVPSPWVGVANGRLLSRAERNGSTVTRWALDEPASSYLVTIAIGDLVMTEDRSASGVPMTYWTPRGRADLLERVRLAPAGLGWLEERLGAFPFSSLGFLVVESKSGMETQTMITLGDTRYATSPEVLVHEMAHQWYGDQVTPVDWRDVWMNEGMAMFLQATWQDQLQDQPIEQTMDYWAELDAQLREDYGPPANYDADAFGGSNVYTSPALMWDELRKRIGDDLFWRLVRDWPAAHDNGNADYDDITAWWSEQSGEDLSGLFDDWLLGETTPERSS